LGGCRTSVPSSSVLSNNLPLCSVGFRPPRWQPVPALV
jgi:hypothetical protein